MSLVSTPYSGPGLRAVVKVGEHYQVTIPEDIREKLGIKPGDELLVSERNGLIIMRKAVGKGLLKFAGCWRGYPEDIGVFMSELRKVWSTWRA